MGFNKKWSVDNILQQLDYCHREVSSIYNDGFTALSCKKDLLTIKYKIDELLSRSPYFGDDEKEIIDELEKQRTWNILNDDSTQRYK